MRLALVILLASCGRIGFSGGADISDGPIDETLDTPNDTALDPAMPGAWQPPRKVPGPLNSGMSEQEPSFTADRLVLVFRRNIGGLWTANRDSVDDEWGNIRELTEIDSTLAATCPGISPDGLTLFFASGLIAPDGGDIWVSTRTDRSATWSTAVSVMAVNTAGFQEATPFLALNGTALVYFSEQNGNGGIYTAFGSPPTSWGPGINSDELETTSFEGAARHWAGARGLVFQSNRSGGSDGMNPNIDLWQASRPTTGDNFGPQTPITELNSTAEEWDPWISEDGRHVMFSSNRSGVLELYESDR